MTNAKPAFVFGDLETTGLEELSDVILEAAFIITDIELGIIAEKSWLILETGWRQALSHASEFVQDMHRDNGLTAELNALEAEGNHNNDLVTVANDIFMWLFTNEVPLPEMPLSGSTIGFDRKFLAEKMPNVNSLFHYRSIDVSSVKELCRRWNPNVYEHYQKTYGSAKKAHRALPDARASVQELEFYCNEFLLVDVIGEIPGQEVINLP